VEPFTVITTHYRFRIVKKNVLELKSKIN